MYELYAHHKGVDHGNAGGNKDKDAPEIGGASLPLAFLSVFCFWLLIKSCKTFKGS
jgi:hypothetical protein